MPESQGKSGKKPKEKPEEKPNFQTQTINGLVILFYKNMLIAGPKQYTTAYSICWAMTKRFKEKDKTRELEKLYKTTKIGFPLGVIQTVVYRDTVLASRLNKTYNYGRRARPVQLGDMIEALDDCMARFLDIFTEICVEHDIDTTLASPIIEGLSLTDKAGL